MNKNAFEIRLDILSMAHSDETNKFYEKLSILKEKDNREFEQYVRQSENTDWKGTIPIPCVDSNKIDELLPKPSDIISRAQELYTFVEKG